MRTSVRRGITVLATAGVVLGLIRSTPTAQLTSTVLLVVLVLASVLVALPVVRSGARAERQAQQAATELQYAIEVERISARYRLSVFPLNAHLAIWVRPAVKVTPDQPVRERTFS